MAKKTAVKRALKGEHKMPNGHMMKNSEMKRKMAKKKMMGY